MAVKVKINIYSNQTKFDTIEASDLIGVISFIRDTRKLFVGKEEYCVVDGEAIENIINNSPELKNYINNLVANSNELKKLITDAKAELTNNINQVKTDLTKDIDNSKTELNNKIDSTKTSLLSEIDTKLQSVFEYKGTKATETALPKSGNKKGDTWNVTDSDHNYVWDGTKWDKLAGVDDNIYWKGDMPEKTKINTHLYNSKKTYDDKSSSEVTGSVVFVDDTDKKTIAVGKNIIYDQKAERDFATKILEDYKKEVDAYHTSKEEIVAAALTDLKKSIVNITDSVSTLNKALEWGGDYTWN